VVSRADGVLGGPLRDRDEAQTVEQMIRELDALRVPMECVLTPFTVIQLAGIVQLALRHPGMSGPHRNTAERFLVAVREYFAACPTTLDVLRRGDDPAEDYEPAPAADAVDPHGASNTGKPTTRD
jgi:hypothetical protein